MLGKSHVLKLDFQTGQLWIGSEYFADVFEEGDHWNKILYTFLMFVDAQNSSFFLFF